LALLQRTNAGLQLRNFRLEFIHTLACERGNKKSNDWGHHNGSREANHKKGKSVQHSFSFPLPGLKHRYFESKRLKTKREINKINAKIDGIDSQNHKSTILMDMSKKLQKDLKLPYYRLC